MLKEIKRKIRKYRKKRYQKVIFSKNDIDMRKKAILFISKILQNNKFKKKNCVSCEFYNKYLNQKNLIEFFKKFNSKLQLKEKYNVKSLKKSTNKNACFKSYILFGEAIKNNYKINNIQKLNTILKLNDLLIFKFNKNKHSIYVKDFMKMINYEKKLLSKFL